MIEVVRATSEETRPLRALYRQQMNCQIVHDSWLDRGWVDSYLLLVNGRTAGYGLVGGVRGEVKDTIIEFYVRGIERGSALPLFRGLIAASGARHAEAQTNDVLTTLMVYDCARTIESNVILFRDVLETHLSGAEGHFRPARAVDKPELVAANLDPEARFVVEADGVIAAAGGVLFHYNPPYGDLYMAVAEPMRRRGFGSFLVQELKRVCYESGHVPAARCNVSNTASRATLQKAGMLPCARLLVGDVGRDSTL